MDIRIVKTWDEMPPVVFDQGEAFSTRVLEKQYRDLATALKSMLWIFDRGLPEGTIGYDTCKKAKEALDATKLKL